MSPEDAARYIANNEKAFFNEFSERASKAELSNTQIAEAFEAMRTGDYAKMATYFDTSSPVDGAVFWSGSKEGAIGDVTYAHIMRDGKPYYGTVWNDIEKKILLQNMIDGKVTNISEVIIDAK